MKKFDGLVLGLRHAELRTPGAFKIISTASGIPTKKIKDIADEKCPPSAAERLLLEGLM